jgi:thiamine biosynthesis lipoprotein
VFNPRWRGAGTLDLGAIAKGFAVDCAARALEAGEGAVLIDLGGNLKAVKRRGEASRQSWRVGVYSPGGGICACVVLRPGEALATSAEYFRGRHIRDGRTGACAAAGVLSVTVLSPSAMMADGLSTTLFAMGPEEGLAFLARVAPEASAFFLMKDGRRLSSGARFLAP